jgi:DNA-binding CsgD family transcriptional regulator
MMLGVREWTKADEDAFARSMLRRRWLNELERSGVFVVGQLRAMSEQQLREIPNVGPRSVADIASALMDRSLRPEDPIELLALPTAPAISERDQELIRMRQQGATLAQIARRFGISRGRVAQILERDGW